MFTERKRIIILIIIAIITNTILFFLTHFLKLPLWLDTTGTILVSVVLGFPAGFLVAIINNVFEAIFFFGDNSLLFYFVSVITAFFAGRIMEHREKNNTSSWMILFAVELVWATATSVLITLLTNESNNNYWSNYIIDLLIENNMPRWIAIVIGVSLIKIFDVVVTVVIARIIYLIIPIDLKTSEVAVQRWKSFGIESRGEKDEDGL